MIALVVADFSEIFAPITTAAEESVTTPTIAPVVLVWACTIPVQATSERTTARLDWNCMPQQYLFMISSSLISDCVEHEAGKSALFAELGRAFPQHATYVAREGGPCSMRKVERFVNNFFSEHYVFTLCNVCCTAD
jgi:hypothetical protein